MVLHKTTLLSCSAAAALAACTPYDPDLGTTPYLCGTVEPRCPGDYSCVEQTPGRSVCVINGGVAPDAPPDGTGGFQCAPDGQLEPNDSIAMAFQTDVGTGAVMRAFGPISICPEGDKDHFQVNITTANRGIAVTTRWDSGMPVSASILNAAGTSIGNGTAAGQNALRACATNLPIGLYYGVAFSQGNMKNNYRIEIKVVDNCQQP